MNNSILKSLNKIRETLIPPINSAGWPFIAGFAFASILLSLISNILGLIGLVLTIWCFYFFRDPIRMTPSREGLIISPACGVVSHIVPNSSLPKEFTKAQSSDSNYTRISIFLSVFDVHVNRIPIKGTIIEKSYKAGAFVNAAFDKASEENERCSLLLETTVKNKKYEIGLVQIAGWVARRIICDAEEGGSFDTGQRFGIIRFGSRVDVYLPKNIYPQVSIGQKMIEGETIIADMASKEKERKFTAQ